MLWTSGQAAVLIGALVTGVLVITYFHRGLTGAAPANTQRPQAAAGDSSPPDWFSALPFNCVGGTRLATGPAAAIAYVDGVSAGTRTGYDVVTIQFAGAPPAETSLSTQSNAKFVSGAGAQPVTLKGNAGALVTLHGTDDHAKYLGPTDVKTTYPVVLELREVQDYGGTVQWAIGLSRTPCYRMAFLDNPTRLVIDFRAVSATN